MDRVGVGRRSQEPGDQEGVIDRSPLPTKNSSSRSLISIQRPSGRQRLDRAGKCRAVGNRLPEPHRDQQVEHVPERAAETQYNLREFDSEGKPFDGSNQYTVTFPKGQVPPVKGFWSLTLYNEEKFFLPNALNRFSLGTKNKTLRYAADGSLNLYLGAKSPGKENEPNWIPAPKGHSRNHPAILA